MRRHSEYYVLINSLPVLPRHFDQPGFVISPSRLDDRLSILVPEDGRIIAQLAEFFRWERQPPERTDKEVFLNYEKIMDGIEYPLVRQIVATLMDIRMIVAAIRRKSRGLPPPEVTVGQWGKHILLHWQRPGFGLGVRHSWVNQVERMVINHKIIEAEKRIIGVIWRYLSDLAQHHYFDFEAVILYLARWDVLNGWLSMDQKRGERRLDLLLGEALEEYGKIFA